MIQLYNSLTRKKEEFQPIKKGRVGMYTCGPTVYDYASIGNFRTYVTADILARLLQFNGYKVKHVMNITDVGHLTGDNLGNADTGEDRLEKSARREGKTAWDIARFYTKAFLKDMKTLNIIKPNVMPKATDNIKEQIALVRQLAEKGLTYKISDGIYFNVQAFEKQTGNKYGELSTLDEIKAGARVEENPEKKDSRDFALWKFSPNPPVGGEKRHMEWKSPWGVGFPGWHIECSAMSMKYLGPTFDIHVGGEDLRATHHPNEIAQSEGATGRKFVNYWVHTTFLQVNGKRMGKSLENFYTISDIDKRGYDPLALRYLYLTAHYRDSLNFTWKSLKSAQRALERLRAQSLKLKSQNNSSKLKTKVATKFKNQFLKAINNDLNTPAALAVVWNMMRSDTFNGSKKSLLLEFDKVLGLGLGTTPKAPKIPEAVKELLSQRENLRKEKKWKESDKARKKIEKMGYTVEDTPEGPRVKPAKK